MTTCVLQCVCASVYLCACEWLCVWLYVFFVRVWVCVRAFMLAFVLKALKRPRSCFFPFPACCGTGLWVYVFIVRLCVLIWFIMEISPRSAAGHLFLSPGAPLCCISPKSLKFRWSCVGQGVLVASPVGMGGKWSSWIAVLKLTISYPLSDSRNNHFNQHIWSM